MGAALARANVSGVRLRDTESRRDGRNRDSGMRGLNLCPVSIFVEPFKYPIVRLGSNPTRDLKIMSVSSASLSTLPDSTALDPA